MVLFLSASNFAIVQGCTLPASAGVISGSANVCQGSTTLNYTVPVITEATSYIWTLPDGVTGTSTTNSITLNFGTAVVSGNITVKGHNACGDGLDATLAINVNPLPVVDFSFNNDNTCSGTAISFTSSVAGIGPFTYLWNFGDGTTSAEKNSSHVFAANAGAGTKLFEVTLSVTNNDTKCVGSNKKSVIVKHSPDASLNTSGGSGATSYDSNQGIFIHCGSTTSSPQFDFVAVNASTTISSNTSTSIDWGDENIDTPLPTFTSITHKYLKLGYFDIKFSVFNSNTGCTSTKVYKFFNGNTPGGSLQSIYNTQDCVPYILTWPVLNTQDNTPGTLYSFFVNDGSPVQSFNQSNLPSSISHTFEKSSCGLGLTNNKFTVSFNVINPCGESPTTSVVLPTQKPVASYDMSPNSSVCTNSAVTFTNTSIGNYAIGNSCALTYNKTWTITPNMGWKVIAGALNGSDILKIRFDIPGKYDVKLNIQQPGSSTSRCTEDEITKNICVESPLIPQFTLSTPTVGCTPLAVTATNITDVSNVCSPPPTYLWNVTYTGSNCGTSSLFTFTNGTNSASKDPSFLFTNPGTYAVSLSVTSSCGTRTSSPQTITVKQPPIVSINTIPSICQTSSATIINPTATVTNCGTGILKYRWRFDGGDPSTSIDVIPESISYSTPGTYTVSLEVENECGTTIANTVSFKINSVPTVTGVLSSCAGFTSQLNGSGTAATILPWISDKPSVAKVNNTGLVTAVSEGTANITYKNSNGCILSSAFVVNTLPTVTGTVSVCIGSTSQMIGSATAAGNLPWLSSNPLVATVSDAGLVSSVSVGTCTITYTNSLGCKKDVLFTVNALSGVSGILVACASTTSQLTGTGTAASSLPWVSANTSIATISNTGLVSAVSEGTSIITYTNANGCKIEVSFSVNPLPTVTGPLFVCAGFTAQLTGSEVASINSPWVSSNNIFASVNNTGLVTAVSAGTANIIYMNTNGCKATSVFKINALPTITGNLSAGIGYTSQLTGLATAASGLAWVSSDPTIATVSNTGLVTALSIGTSTISYTNSTDCKKDVVFTVSNLPVIGGTLSACVGAISQLNGTATAAANLPWVSSNPLVAKVDNTGLVTGVSEGTAAVKYTNSVGSQVSATFTVNALPTVTGTLSVGIGYTSQLNGSGLAATNSPWVSEKPSVATVSSTGLLTALSVGTTAITYTNSDGCLKVITFTVSSLPTIGGNLSVCIGKTSQLTGAGVAATISPWVSSDISAAGVNNTGLVTAISEGITNITFTNSVGSQVNLVFTVNALPTLTGILSSCIGSTSQLIGSGTAATSSPWKSSNTTVATVSNTGLITALSEGSAIITYTNSNGCAVTSTFIVNALPVVTGPLSVCIGSVSQLAGTGTPSGSLPWISSNMSVATVNSNGLVTALSAGVSTITYKNANNCFTNVNFTVKPTPNVDPFDNLVFCNGQQSNIINFSGNMAVADFDWMNSNSSIGLFGSGSGNIASFKAKNTGISPIEALITITPTSNGCLGSSKTFTIVVNPSPNVTFTLENQTICTGESTAFITLNSSTLGVAYSWISVVPTGITGAAISGTGIIPVQTLVNTTNADLVVIYKAKATVAGLASCAGAEAIYTITVKPKPLVTQQFTASICSGSTFSVTPTDGNGNTIPVGTTYRWTALLGNCTGSDSGQGTSISDVLLNTVKTTSQVLYTITPYGPTPNSCTGATFTLEVNVLPVAQVASTFTTQSVVAGQKTIPVTFTSDVTGANFDWEFSSSTAPLFLSTPLQKGTTATIPAQLLTILPNGPSSCTLIYTVTPWFALPDGGKCMGIPFDYNIVINSEPVKKNLLCPGPVCAGTAAVITLEGSDIGVNYQLLESWEPVTGEMQQGKGVPLTWLILKNDTYTILATNTNNQQAVLMSGQCVVTINPNPISNYVIGSTGNCQGDVITLNGSQEGVLYELYNGAVNTLISRSGTGPLDFGAQTTIGTYKIKATFIASGCSIWIDNEIIILPLPLQYLLAPAGPLCAGDEFSLQNSETGITYILWCYPIAGGLPQNLGSWPGTTGRPVNFGIQNIPGNYKVEAFNASTLCGVFMKDEKMIWENPIPYNIMPDGGPFCGMTTIVLSNSQTGYFYEVHDKVSGEIISTPNPKYPILKGTGSSISFGSNDVPGTYVIIGFDPNQICRTLMYGEVTILESPTPYLLIPSGSHCIDPVVGLEVKLEHSDIGVDYTLSNGYKSITLAGSNNQLSFGNITQEGTYTVTAFNPLLKCTKVMTGTIVIQLNPTIYNMYPVLPTCPGEDDIWLSGSDIGITYTLYSPSGLPIPRTGGGGVLNWGRKSDPGKYYIIAQSATTPCNTMMAGTVIVKPNPEVFAVKYPGINCEPADIGMINSQINTTYEIIDHHSESFEPLSTYIPAVAGPFWFGAALPAGTYSVRATTSTGCSTLMNGDVKIDTRVTVDAGPAEITICNVSPYVVNLNGTATNYASVKWFSPTDPEGSNFSNQNSLTTAYTFTQADILNKVVMLTLKAYGDGGCIDANLTDVIKINVLAPVVNAGPDQAICENTSASLQGSIIGGATTGIWSGGLGAFIPNRSAIFNAVYLPDPSETGTVVKLTLTSTNANSCTNTSDDVYVTIYHHFVAGVVTPDQEICYGESLLLIGSEPTGGSGNFTYQWQVLDGIKWIDLTTPDATILHLSTGKLTATTKYRLRQTDGNCTPNKTEYAKPVTISVHGLLAAGSALGSQTVCYGASGKLSGTAPTGGSSNIIYQWQEFVSGVWVNATLGSGWDALIYTTGALIGNTQYRLMQTDVNCNPGQVVYTNAVDIMVDVPTATAGKDDTICGLNPYVLSGAGSEHTVKYVWTTSGTGTFIDQYYLNATYFPSPADMNFGSAILTLSASDKCSNTATDNMTLTFGQLPVAFFSFSTPTCSNSPIFFTDRSRVNNGFINKWVWDFGDGTRETIVFPGNPNVHHIFASLGPSYMVKLIVYSSLGCNTEFQQLITSLQGPVANYSFSKVRCDNRPMEFTSTSQINGGLGMQPWSWDFGDPFTGINNTSNLLNPVHQFSDSGVFKVSLIVLNSNNCLDTISKEVTVNTHPPLDYTFNKTCLNERVNFNPDPSKTDINSISTWNWDFGDGVKSNLRNTVHVYKSPGIFNVSLSVTDTVGCENIIQHVVTINALPVAHFDAGSANCAGSIVSFNELTSTSAGYVVRWIWDFGDGKSQTVEHPNNANVTHVYPNSGTYNVTLTIETSDSCSNSQTIAITIYPRPVVNFDFTKTCENMVVSFNDLTQNNGGGNLENWRWNFGDTESGANNVSTLKNPTHTFVGAHTFNVNLVVSNNNGCKDSLVRAVIINTKPLAKFTASVARCEGDAVTFTDNSTPTNGTILLSYLWNFGDNITSSLSSPSHIYSTYGTFPVKLIIVNSKGCEDSVIQQVTVNPKPVVDFSVSEVRCTGNPVVFADHTFVPTGFSGSIAKWEWDFGDGYPAITINSPAIQNSSHTFPGSATTFAVKLKVLTTAGCAGYGEKLVELMPSPVANFSYSGTQCDNKPVQFTNLSEANGGGNLQSWSWNFGDPLSGANNTSTLQGPSHSFTGSGSYVVSLTVTNINGCQHTLTQAVLISPILLARFTPSNTHCEGETVTFNNESTTPEGTAITSYKWNFGDNGTSDLPSPTHVYTTYGNNTVTLNIVNSMGCIGTEMQELTVKAKPVAGFSVSELRCAARPLSFTDHSFVKAGFNGFIMTWVWDFGDGSAPFTVNYPTSPNVTHTFAQGTTSAKVKLTVTTNSGCSGFIEDNLTVNTASFTGSYGPYCISDSPVNLLVTPEGGTFSGLGVQGKYFSPADAGVGFHTIMYTSPEGSCPVAPIIINVISTPIVKTTTQFLTSCNGIADLSLSKVTVGSTPGLYFTYFTDAMATNPVINPQSVTVGTYYIKGSTMSGKCTGIQPVVVAQSDTLKAKLVAVSPACSGSASGSLAVALMNGTTPFTFQWNTDPVQNTASIKAIKAGIYTVTVTDALLCSVTLTDTLKDNPDVKIYMSHKDLQCTNDVEGSARVDSIAGIGKALALNLYTYKWNTTPVQTVREATRLANGYYTVTMTDTKGCGIKDSVLITVLDTISPTIVCRLDTISIVLQSFNIDPLVNTQNSIVVDLSKPESWDNCGVASLTNDAPEKFKLGITEVKWTVSDYAGLSSTCKQVVYIKKIPTIPKLLSPNGDGLNDYLEIDGLKDFPKSQLSIFTRSGQLVFSSYDYKNEWDGRFMTSNWSHNQIVAPGVYYYILSLGGTTQKLKGFVYIYY